MNCEEIRRSARDWIQAGQIPPDSMDHLMACSACARVMDQERALSSALEDLRRENSDVPDSVEIALLAAFRTCHTRARRIRLAWVAAAGILLCAVVWGYRWRGGQNRQLHAAAPYVEGQFYPIAPGQAIEEDSFAPVIRMRLPRQEWKRIGLPPVVHTALGEDSLTLDVDVLVGRDGVAKAVRLARDGKEFNLEGVAKHVSE